jgi:hypothetical protein
MHYLEKSPGMCSDRPGTTPKGLDLVVFPTCLREKERDTFGVCVRFGGGGEGDIQYKSSLADPTILSSRGLSAVLWRTVRLWNFYTATDWNCLCPTCADRPRSFGGLSAMNFCGWQLLCRASDEQVQLTADCPPLTRGPSALPKIWQVWILPIFSIPTPILDHCSYKNPKISNIAWKPSNDLYEQVSTRIQK